MQPSDYPTLSGYRRELTKETFEEVMRLQTTPGEILGYIGTTEKKLAAWCRKVYRRPLKTVVTDIRADGLIELRRAAFDQMKKNATLIEREYNRYLPAEGAAETAPEVPEAFIALSAPGAETVESLFGDPDAGEGA